MKTTSLALLALGLVTPLVSAQEKPAPADASAPKVYKLGSVVDETLALPDLDGKTLSFKELRGKVVLIHFWSTTCPYEEVADPKVVELEKRWKDQKDVVILAINANSTEIGEKPPADGYAKVKEHAKKKGFTHRILADHGNKVADLFQAKSTPHCFVLDRQGKVVYAGGLDDDPKGDKGAATQQFAASAVEAALAGKEISVKESKPYGCSIKRVKA
ncbi:MAG TPA: redoxin domain-containing protein [Planctomycetota bacterium]